MSTDLQYRSENHSLRHRRRRKGSRQRRRSQRRFPELGRRDIAKLKPGKKDVVIGIAASGRTPYTIAACEYAKKKGAKTACVVCNLRLAASRRPSTFPSKSTSAPRSLAGSTRLKAGTAQKLVLNMITTGAMTRLGYVYGNLMVNVHLKNAKLVERGIGIVRRRPAPTATKPSPSSKKRPTRPTSPIVMIEADLSAKDAENA